MDIFDMDVYKINRRYLSLCGMWPFETSPINSRVKKYIVDVSLIVAITLQVLKFYTSPYSLELIVEILAHFLPTMCVVTSYVTFCVNMENIKILLQGIKDDWSSVKSKCEEDIIRKFAKKGRMFTLILTVTYNTTIFSTMFISTVPIIMDTVLPLNETRIRKLPVQLECFLDPNVYFLEILLLTYVLMTIQGIAGISTWTTLIMIIQHICGMFELTGHVIQKAFDLNRNEIHADKTRARLIRGIKLHKRTIKSLDLMNVVIEYANLMAALLAVILYGTDFLRLFQTELEIDNFVTNAISVIYFIGHVSFMFLTCHIGQKVLDYSSNVFRKACDTPWYDAPQDIHKLILVVLMRTINPSYLSMGGMFVASYELFAAIIRMSMSYATVFYSLLR